MSTKAREFWIDGGGESLSGRYYEPKIYYNHHPDTIHVIEYSAYEELRRQNEVLLELIKNTKCKCRSFINDELEVGQFICFRCNALSKCGKGGSV